MDRPLDTALTTDMLTDPRLHRLGLMVSPVGADVVITSRVKDDFLIHRHFDYPAGMPAVKALEEIVYSNPLLTADFGRIDIVIDNRRFFVMAADEATGDEVDRRVGMLYPSDGNLPQLEVMVNPIEDGRTVMVSAVERDLMRFVRRTFNNPPVTHRMAALARYYGLRNRMGNSGKIHVRPGAESTDIIVYGHQGLMMANTFDTRSAADAVYYTLAAAKHLGYDHDTDRIMVGGDIKRRADFLNEIRRFVPFVMPEIFPAALKMLGDDAQKVPFEIIILPLCE